MTEESARAAVLAQPDADAPRLAYADAVESVAPARAQLIRAQIAATHKRRAGQSWHEEMRLINQLLGAHAARWTPALPVAVASMRFYRGFVEFVAAPIGVLAGALDAIAHVVPLRHANVTNAHNRCNALTRAPGFDRLVSLSLADNQLDDDDARVVAGFPRGRVRWLDLSNNRIGAPGLDALAASPALRQVDFVDLMGNPCGDPVDHAIFDGSELVDAHPTPLGAALEDVHGPIAWLHAPLRHPRHWPPERGDC